MYTEVHLFMTAPFQTALFIAPPIKTFAESVEPCGSVLQRIDLRARLRRLRISFRKSF